VDADLQAAEQHIQRVLIEAAKLAPRECHELAVIRARGLERGNPNRATLAVGLRACREVQPNASSVKAFPNKEKAKTSGFIDAQTARSRRLPTRRRSKTPEAHYELFRDWQRTPTRSSVTALRSPRQQMDVRFCMGRNHQPRGIIALSSTLIRRMARSPKRAQKPRAFRLTLT